VFVVVPARKQYTNGAGYRKAGQVYFPSRSLPFFCFETILSMGSSNLKSFHEKAG
jgi:hypothetical protein